MEDGGRKEKRMDWSDRCRTGQRKGLIRGKGRRKIEVERNGKKWKG